MCATMLGLNTGLILWGSGGRRVYYFLPLPYVYDSYNFRSIHLVSFKPGEGLDCAVIGVQIYFFSMSSSLLFFISIANKLDYS